MPQSLFLHMPPVTPFINVTNVTALKICLCDLTKILIIILRNLYSNICPVHFYVIFHSATLYALIHHSLK